MLLYSYRQHDVCDCFICLCGLALLNASLGNWGYLKMLQAVYHNSVGRRWFITRAIDGCCVTCIAYYYRLSLLMKQFGQSCWTDTVDPELATNTTGSSLRKKPTNHFAIYWRNLPSWMDNHLEIRTECCAHSLVVGKQVVSFHWSFSPTHQINSCQCCLIPSCGDLLF